MTEPEPIERDDAITPAELVGSDESGESTGAEDSTQSSKNGRWRLPLAWRVAILCALAAGVVAVVYIRSYQTGDDPNANPQAGRKGPDGKPVKPAKPKPPVELGRMNPLPTSFDEKAPEGARASRWIKPGHWTAVMQSIKANQRDLSTDLRISPVDDKGRPVDLPKTAARYESTRPVSLQKGRNKFVEMTLLAPVATQLAEEGVDLETLPLGTLGRPMAPARVYFERQLQHSLTGGDVYSAVESLRCMEDCEYFFFVLARQPKKYGFLARLPSTKSAREVDEYGFSETPDTYYRIVTNQASPNAVAPLPSNPLAWTSIAVFLWDDYDPADLSPDQRRALVDWLHWGGRLIVSGPGSLDLLKGSFLEPFLPARSNGAREITADDLAQLNDAFGDKKILDGHAIPATPGVQLVPHELAKPVALTGELVYQRRIGRGHVFVTAFPVSPRLPLDWDSRQDYWNVYDRFFARVFFSRESLVVEEFLEPDDISDLRYFSRDPGRIAAEEASVPKRSTAETAEFLYRERHSIRYDSSSAAAWNDFSAAADAARGTLREAAGIKIPEASFVVRIIAGYLIFLVPVNWLVFRLLRRVEWAWFVIPIGAIGCAIYVVDRAQLDIGFARSRTEVAVVELQGEYARAHVTRYSALYTSLSTGYEISVDDPHALVLPFSKGEAFRRAPGQRSMEVEFHRKASDAVLSGFQVASNTTDWLHAEQMVDVGGPIKLDRLAGGTYAVTNRTNLAMQGAAVVREGAGGSRSLAWIGEFTPGKQFKLLFERVDDVARMTENWKASPIVAGANAARPLNLAPLLSVAIHSDRSRPGEMRLIAWTDEPIAGMTVDPDASQTSYAALVLARLKYAP